MANFGEVQYRFKRNKSKAFVAFEADLRGKYGDTGGMRESNFSLDTSNPDYLIFHFQTSWGYAPEFLSPLFRKTLELEVFDVLSNSVIASGMFEQHQAEAFCLGVSEILSGSRFNDSLVLAVGNEEIDMVVKGFQSREPIGRGISAFFYSQYGIPPRLRLIMMFLPIQMKSAQRDIILPRFLSLSLGI